MKPSEVQFLKKNDLLYRCTNGKVEVIRVHRVGKIDPLLRKRKELFVFILDGKNEIITDPRRWERTRKAALHRYLTLCQEAIPAYETSINTLQQQIDFRKAEIARVEKLLKLE